MNFLQKKKTEQVVSLNCLLPLTYNKLSLRSPPTLMIPRLSTKCQIRRSRSSHVGRALGHDPGGPTSLLHFNLGRTLSLPKSIRGNPLVSTDNLRTLVLDPTEALLYRIFDFSLDGVNLILSDPLLSLHFRIAETPGRLRRALTRPGRPRRDRRSFGRVIATRVDLIGAHAETLPANDLHPAITSVTPLTRAVSVHLCGGRSDFFVFSSSV